MNYNRFYKGVVSIVKDREWSVYQMFLILNLSILSFFSISMLNNGYSKNEILIAFAIYYAMIVVSLLYVSANEMKRDLKIRVISISIAILLSISLCFNGAYILTAPFIMTGFSVLKDIYSVNAISNFKNIALNTSNSEKDIISLSTLLGMICPVLFIPVFGMVNDMSLNYVLCIYLVSMSFVLVARKPASCTKTGTVIISSKKPKRPTVVHLICALSTTANMVSFVVRYFVVPSTVFIVAKNAGIEKDAIKVLGLILGIMAIVSLIRPKKSNTTSYSMMIKGYLAVILSASSLTILALINNYIESAIMTFALVLIAFSAFEISSRIWTVSFIDTLCSISKCKQSKKSYLSTFMVYKSLGGLIGFGLVALLYHMVDIRITVFSLCFIAVIYVVVADRIICKNHLLS